MRQVFTVAAVWDDEAGVCYSDSDISGLHIEADTLEEFERDLFAVAADFIAHSCPRSGAAPGQTKDDVLRIVY
jgi:hypothetical protein